MGWSRVIGAVVAAWCAPALAGVPPVSGTYAVNGLGLFKFKTDGDRVTATWSSGGPCRFTADEQVLDASLEGSLLVGTFSTCAEPASCGALVKLPFLGVFSRGVMTAFVEAPAGCTTPGIEGALTFTPTNATRLESAQALLKKGDLEAATVMLRPAAEKPDATLDAAREFYVLYFLGGALNLKREFQEARPIFLRAASYTQAPAEERAEVFFNLACAEAQLLQKDPGYEAQALEHLREALKVGKPGQFRAEFSTDEQLAPLRGLPEFKKLSDLAKRGGR
jgi:hypothetical protein